MRNLSIASAVMVIALVNVAAPVFSEKMETKPTGILTGIKGHQATGKVTITKDMKGNPILTMMEIKVD